MPLLSKRTGWQHCFMGQGATGGKFWWRELQPRAGRGKVCNELTPSSLAFACNGQSPFETVSDSEGKIRPLRGDRT